jgi:anthranilate synthase/aminodeoxychorismate synthase-like glutamine amidotransferase
VTILIIDNYDSFTYNLVQAFGELGVRSIVRRNDQVTLSDIESLPVRAIVISPGPGRPRDAGISVAVIRAFEGRRPILGVCLGHQCIGEAYGARIVHARQLMHGRTSLVHHEGASLFAGMPRPFPAARYHSLAVSPRGLPAALEVTAAAEDGTIMGLRHRRHSVAGVQFHPESFMTAHGLRMLRNFLDGRA